MDINFSGKIALVTGASSGLGRATALGFAAAGASVFLVDINQAGLDETKAAIDAAGGVSAIFCGDISAKANCVAAVEAAVAAFGRLDILCNVAGIVKFARIPDVTEADWERMMRVNLHGPFYLCQAAIPHLLASHGNIVNVASSAALKGQAYLCPYATSKAALVHMTKSMAMEYVHKPIRINAVAPGSMHTGMAETTTIPEGLDFSLIGRYSGLRAISTPEDVAETILFVASDHAKSIHGACVSVDGGITAD